MIVVVNGLTDINSSLMFLASVVMLFLASIVCDSTICPLSNADGELASMNHTSQDQLQTMNLISQINLT